MKKIFKAIMAAAFACASWFGFIATVDQFAWIGFILVIQSFVWLFLTYEWGMDCVEEEKRVPLHIIEEDYDMDDYDEF